jgi:hypothetical protein
MHAAISSASISNTVLRLVSEEFDDASWRIIPVRQHQL